MFKDYNKYLNVSLKVYLFILVVIFIMRLVGLNYFGLDVNNPKLIELSTYLSKNHLGDLYNFITLYVQLYFYTCLATDKSRIYKESFITTLCLFIPQCILFVFYKLDWIYYFYSIALMIISPIIINKKFFVKKQIKYLFLISLYQFICLTIRNVGVNNNYGNFLIDSLLNVDQIVMLGITYNLHFMEGGLKLCGVEQAVSFSSLKKMNLKNLLEKLQKYLHSFKSKDKETQIAIIIYLLLSFIWNVFTIVVVLAMAILNDTLIECLFILTSFWLSKRRFSKPFHLKSMVHCFIVSSLSYYILNRITTPLGISIFVPIILGVGLSYFTSKLVKETYKPLYKGMPEDVFEHTILKVVEKDSLKYKICYEFYIEGKSDLSLTFKYNYSLAGIRKIKSRVNDSIKRLS